MSDTANNPLQLKRIHHVEFYVGNARQAAFFYRNAFGFSQFAYSGLETGNRETASYALEQGEARLLFTTPYSPDHAINAHILKHGDGVKDIAFEVDDADAAYSAALANGAESAYEPYTQEDGNGSLRRAGIKTYGETIHSFISVNGYKGPFLPGFAPKPLAGNPVGILRIDHMVGNVELGKMNYWAEWYENVLGFKRYITFDDKDISTEYSALMSMVMANNSYAVKFPINEPAEGKKKSQIDEYLDFYQGPGVQHTALLTSDIVATVGQLVRQGVEFLKVPDAYYEGIEDRVGKIDEDIQNVLKPLGVLIDRDEDGYLLQLFSKPVEDRPTLFYEIIQRKGCRGFGKGNFRALFEAIEREQELRGNL
jgi:4-hydroxyphenylpyruvate dioxygenase